MDKETKNKFSAGKRSRGPGSLLLDYKFLGVLIAYFLIIYIFEVTSDRFFGLFGHTWNLAINISSFIFLLIPCLLIAIRSIKVSIRDREELAKKDKLFGGVTRATNILLEASDHEAAFSEALHILGEAAGADRVYIYELQHPDETGAPSMSLKYEWCRLGEFSAANAAKRRDIGPDYLSLAWWASRMVSGKAIKSLASDLPDGVRGSIPRGAKSIISFPIFIGEELWGSIGYDDFKDERVWSDNEEASLKMAAASIAAAVKRMRYEEKLQVALQKDFLHTIRNLQNLIFKFRKDEDGAIRFSLFEGIIARQLGLKTEDIPGKTVAECFPAPISEYLENNFKKSLEGEATSFELEYSGRVFFTTLSPIRENNNVSEVVGTAIDVTDRKLAEKQIKYYAYHDALTGLPNRTLFTDRLGYAISHAYRNKSIVVVMLLDLDRFKITNDSLGYSVGDLLLKAVAGRLKDRLSECDTIARMGGDEYALLLAGAENEKSAAHIAQKVNSIFKDPFFINEHELFISTSVGISFYPYDGEDSATLVKNAETAMYRAKENGKNSYQFYTQAMNERALERLTIENELRKALERDEFALLYQPQVDLETGRILGCEALIRWNHPVLGTVAPADFVPLAEETGLIVQIGEWVLYRALSDWKEFADDSTDEFRVSVNISARQFQLEDFVDSINSVLESTGFNPRKLSLEITENIIMQNTLRNLAAIHKLKAIGIEISIDDFGTGFSSLSYLKQFDADVLKIDKSFISNLSTDHSDAALTTEIINIAHNLNLKVIAEGVETEEQFRFLKAKGCDGMQGYFISPPVACGELFEMYRLGCRHKLSQLNKSVT